MPEEIQDAISCGVCEENPAVSWRGGIEHYQVSQRFFPLFFCVEAAL
jgi:hypothetical protein